MSTQAEVVDCADCGDADFLHSTRGECSGRGCHCRQFVMPIAEYCQNPYEHRGGETTFCIRRKLHTEPCRDISGFSWEKAR